MKTVVCTLQCSDLYIASEASHTTNYCLVMFVCQGAHLAVSSLDFQAYTMTTIIIMCLQLCDQFKETGINSTQNMRP